MTMKETELLARAKEALAEAAKIPTPQASTYAEVKEFVSKARDAIVPGVSYHKKTDTTLITLQNNRNDKKLQIDAGLLSSFLAEAGRDSGAGYTKTVLANAISAVISYADSIERARTGLPQSAPVSRGGLKLVA